MFIRVFHTASNPVGDANNSLLRSPRRIRPSTAVPRKVSPSDSSRSHSRKIRSTTSAWGWLIRRSVAVHAQVVVTEHHTAGHLASLRFAHHCLTGLLCDGPPKLSRKLTLEVAGRVGAEIPKREPLAIAVIPDLHASVRDRLQLREATSPTEPIVALHDQHLERGTSSNGVEQALLLAQLAQLGAADPSS